VQEVILSCLTKCTLNDKHTYIWYKNGRQVTDGFTKVNKLASTVFLCCRR
ncbi:hypothetical protein M9458_043712, partial [Cirrhinus mrigala]